jgi:RNA polymerase sigma-70 factor (ECF subfamily)
MRLLADNSIARADAQLGKFRTFLLGALKHFLADAQRKADAWKRGGGVEMISFEQAQAEERYQLEPVDDRTPDKIFEQRWTVVLLETAATRLRGEFAAAGKARQFEVLKPFLTSEGDENDYAQAGAGVEPLRQNSDRRRASDSPPLPLPRSHRHRRHRLHAGRG